jgi:D-alanyl-D-alanine carboxypeptidase
MPNRRNGSGFWTLALAAAFLAAAGTAGCEGGSGNALASARSALERSSIPSEAKKAILAAIDRAPDPFEKYLAGALADRRADPMLLYRVDKPRALPEGYAPADLVALDGTGLSLSRAGHQLREGAFRALKAMDAAARAEGITLLVSSSYRSYAYQVEVWNRGIQADGEAETEASVARPGHSQHQLGTAIDFGSITDAFAKTKAGLWLKANARRFGFSLSYPEGQSQATGYKWESWHYRYIGKSAAAMEGAYFGGMQQYLLLFLDSL